MAPSNLITILGPGTEEAKQRSRPGAERERERYYSTTK